VNISGRHNPHVYYALRQLDDDPFSSRRTILTGSILISRHFDCFQGIRCRSGRVTGNSEMTKQPQILRSAQDDSYISARWSVTGIHEIALKVCQPLRPMKNDPATEDRKPQAAQFFSTPLAEDFLCLAQTCGWEEMGPARLSGICLVQTKYPTPSPPRNRLFFAPARRQATQYK
jgi:hypothetical protein